MTETKKYNRYESRRTYKGATRNPGGAFGGNTYCKDYGHKLLIVKEVNGNITKKCVNCCTVNPKED